jgi:hypothetical protein
MIVNWIKKKYIYISLELSMFGLIRIQQAPSLMSHHIHYQISSRDFTV